MTLQKGIQDLCAGEDGLQRDGFEQGIAFIFQWVAMFLAVGEWCAILLRELLKTLPRAEAQQKLTIIQLETCLALPFHSDPIGEEDSPQDPCDDFHVLHITPDTFKSWLSACESAAGISKKDIPPVEVIIPPVDVVVEDNALSHSKGLFPKPQRERPPYVRKKKSREKPSSTDKGGKGFG